MPVCNTVRLDVPAIQCIQRLNPAVATNGVPMPDPALTTGARKTGVFVSYAQADRASSSRAKAAPVSEHEVCRQQCLV